jgi:hypothetical protein
MFHRGIHWSKRRVLDPNAKAQQDRERDLKRTLRRKRRRNRWMFFSNFLGNIAGSALGTKKVGWVIAAGVAAILFLIAKKVAGW